MNQDDLVEALKMNQIKVKLSSITFNHQIFADLILRFVLIYHFSY